MIRSKKNIKGSGMRCLSKIHRDLDAEGMRRFHDGKETGPRSWSRRVHAARTSFASSRTLPLDLALVLDAPELQR